MSAPGEGYTTWTAVLGAAGAAGSKTTFTPNPSLNRKAKQVIVTDMSDGHVLGPLDVQIVQTVNSIAVANLGLAGVTVQVEALYEFDSTQDNDLHPTDPRLAAGVGPAGPPGGGSLTAVALFFGMTAGPGNTGANDYAATIPVSTGLAPASIAVQAIPFPRTGPASGPAGITHPTSRTFQLAQPGTYRVQVKLSVDEAAQIQLAVLDGAGPNYAFPNTAAGNFTIDGRATGTNDVFINTLITTVNPNALLAVLNAFSVAALTVTPTPGGTQAQAPTIIIQKV